MNEVIMMGRLATDVTLRDTRSDSKVANYRIAVERRFKKEGAPTADFFNCTVFGKGAEFAANYLTKGTKVLIRGELRNDNYQDKNGNMVYRENIVVNSQEFAESKAASKNASPANTATQTTAPTKSSPTPPINSNVDENGFLKIPDGIDEELPFA